MPSMMNYNRDRNTWTPIVSRMALSSGGLLPAEEQVNLRAGEYSRVQDLTKEMQEAEQKTIEDMMSALWELLKGEDGFHADLSSMAAVNILNHLQTALDRYRETALEIETDLKDYGEKLSEDDSI